MGSLLVINLWLPFPTIPHRKLQGEKSETFGRRFVFPTVFPTSTTEYTGKRGESRGTANAYFTPFIGYVGEKRGNAGNRVRRFLNLWPGVRVTPGAPLKTMSYGGYRNPFSLTIFYLYRLLYRYSLPR